METRDIKIDGTTKRRTEKMERGRKEEIKRKWRMREIKWKLKTGRKWMKWKGFEKERDE